MTQTPTKPEQVGIQPRYTITDADKKRVRAIQAAWSAYDGQLDKPLKPMPDEADDNVMSNACAPIVDTGVYFLFGQELEISVSQDAPDEAQDVLNNVWGRKETRIPLLQDLAMNGAHAGRAFLRLVPVGGSPTGIPKQLRLITVDPTTIYVQSDPQDVETVQLFCIEYSAIEQVNGKDSTVYYREEISRNDPDDDGDDGNPFADTDATWILQHWTRIGERGPWQSVGEPIQWPYSFPPIFSCKNLPRPNSYWGKPDITSDIIGMNSALNLAESSINRNLKMFGQPILYSNGTGEGTIDIAPGKIIQLPLAESKITSVTLSSDVANALKFVEDIRSNLDEMSGVPGIATGRLVAQPRGDMSGVAIELLYITLLEKTEVKRCLYGELIIDVSKAILTIMRMSPDIDLTLNWSSPLPHNDMASAQTALIKIQAGISKTTALRELGYDPDEESDLNDAEAQHQATAFSRGQGMPPTAPPNAQAGMQQGNQQQNQQQSNSNAPQGNQSVGASNGKA